MADPRNKPTWRVETFANPAAGAEIIITPTTAAAWLIQSIAFTLTTDATATDRSPSLVADNGSAVYFRSPATGDQSPSTAIDYSAFAGSAGGFGTGQPVIVSFPAVGLLLPQGHRLRTVTAALAAADQYSAVAALILEYPTGPLAHFWPVPYMMEEEAS